MWTIIYISNGKLVTEHAKNKQEACSAAIKISTWGKYAQVNENGSMVLVYFDGKKQ